MKPLLFLLMIIHHACDATNYYLSSSTGNDLNNGTSIDYPWKSLSKLSSLSLQPGDNVLLKSSDTFTQQLYLQYAYGSEAKPITITTYTTSNTLYYHRAIINKQQNTQKTNSTILCLNCQNIIISNLELCHSHFGIALVYSYPHAIVAENILIKNNYFHDLCGNGSSNSSQWWGAAVVTGQNSTNGKITITNLNIVNNFCNASDTFFKISGYTIQAVELVNGVINGNTMTYNYYNIVFLGNVMQNFSIINNIFLHNSPIKEFNWGTTDLIIVHSDNLSNVINNEFGYRGEWITSYDGCAIDFESNAFGTQVINNYIHHSYGAGIMIYGHPPAVSNNLNISNNIFIEDGCYQQHPDHGSIAFIKANTSGIVQNSIFVKCQNNLSVPIFWDNNKPQNIDTWEFVNNTIYNTTIDIVDDPIIEYNRNVKDNSVDITAKCGQNVVNDCLITYTLDGSKPSSNSMQYKETVSINVTTPVFFKAFSRDKIESAAVGKIVAIL